IEKLEEDGLAAPSVQLGGITLDAEELLGLLRETTEELGQVLAALPGGRRDTEQRLVDKRTFMQGFDREAKWTARLLEAAFRLAGQDQLAGRVRRTVRRSTEVVEIEMPEIEMPEFPEAKVAEPALVGA
ncbi:MAG: hypothetical protein KDD47_24720, partial [Acidobacteria bacterium]|nr:hypothetical protein [Acidobacteriota bacterium]